MRLVKVILFLASALTIRGSPAQHLTDINKISRYWGQMSPYVDNADNSFGVEYTGLPSGCQIESVQTLQRHAERFPNTGRDDGGNIMRFGDKIIKFKSNHPNQLFTGPLEFLNSWHYIFNTKGFLTGIGAVAEVRAGVDFWNRYGRILFNASIGQLAYDPNFPNGTARAPVVLRTTEQSRMHNTLINWALGFFGSTTQAKPNPSFVNVTQPFSVVIIPEETEGKWNNTLASYISCQNLRNRNIGKLGERLLEKYSHKYLGQAMKRLRNFTPPNLSLEIDDMRAVQLLCAYEFAFIRASEFCNLFTEDEWAGFENSLDIKYYYDHAFGSPLGRAQGIGYVQEMLARLNHVLIHSSSTSVNSTLDGNQATFPTNQAFYADFTHDTVIIAALTALSVDYFHDAPNFTEFPPNPNRKFIMSKISPFGSNLITESIGCTSPNPEPRKNRRVQYTAGQDGYEAPRAPYKFVRMRLNNGIIPLNTIRGGACGDNASGRADGMCALEKFLESQKNSTALANYQYACFSNLTIHDIENGRDWDGTIFT